MVSDLVDTLCKGWSDHGENYLPRRYLYGNVLLIRSSGELPQVSACIDQPLNAIVPTKRAIRKTLEEFVFWIHVLPGGAVSPAGVLGRRDDYIVSRYTKLYVKSIRFQRLRLLWSMRPALLYSQFAISDDKFGFE